MCLSVGNRNQLGPTQPVGLPPPPLRPAFLGSQLSPEHQALRKELAAGLESPGVGSSTPPPPPPPRHLPSCSHLAALHPQPSPRAALAEDGQKDRLPGLCFLRRESCRRSAAQAQQGEKLGREATSLALKP